MKVIMEAFWAITFVLLWLVVLPVAALVEIGVLVSDKIDYTMRRTSSSA